MILKKLSLLVKNQRIVLKIFYRDSLDYIEGVETAISKEESLKQ